MNKPTNANDTQFNKRMAATHEAMKIVRQAHLNARTEEEWNALAAAEDTTREAANIVRQAHLGARTEEGWNALDAARDRMFEGTTAAEALNDAYLAVADNLHGPLSTMGIPTGAPTMGETVARVGGEEVFITKGESQGWAAKEFDQVMQEWALKIEDHFIAQEWK